MIIELKDAIRRVNCLGFIKLIDCMPRYIPQKFNHLKCEFSLMNTNINALIRNKDLSPLGVVKFNFHIKMPLFVKLEWSNNNIINHINDTQNELYIPQNIISKDSNKITEIYKNVLEHNLKSLEYYENLINLGVSKEMASIFLPKNIYVEFYWCIDLKEYIELLNLYNDKNFFPETIEYINASLELVRDLCPITFKAYDEYMSKTILLTKREQTIIKNNLNNFNVLNFHFNNIDDKKKFLDKLNNMD